MCIEIDVITVLVEAWWHTTSLKSLLWWNIGNIAVIVVIIIIIIIIIIQSCRFRKLTAGVNDATADQSCRKCLRMTLHFPFAKPQTASETARWFLGCPQWRGRCISSMDSWLHEPADSMANENILVLSSSWYFAVLLSATYLAAPCSVAVNSNETRQVSGTVIFHNIDFPFVQNIQVTGHLRSRLRPTCSLTGGICVLLITLFMWCHSSECHCCLLPRSISDRQWVSLIATFNIVERSDCRVLSKQGCHCSQLFWAAIIIIMPNFVMLLK